MLVKPSKLTDQRRLDSTPARLRGALYPTFAMDFFISHTRSDQRWAEWIAWQLERAGYATIIDVWDFQPGSNFVLEMHKASSVAAHTIAVLSPSFLAALFTQPEWAAALARDPAGTEGTLLPVRVEVCELEGILRSLLYVDLVGLDEELATKALLTAAARRRRKPASSPQFPGRAAEPVDFPQTAMKNVATPRYPNREIRKLSESLEEAYERREELVCAGGDPAAIQQEILSLRRQIREGGQLRPGDFLQEGRFRLLERIGRGGFATVWRAYDRPNRALVAIKVLHADLADDRTRRERFFRGARKMWELQHPNIVRVFDRKIEDGGYSAFSMELLAGGDLRHAVLKGTLSFENRLEIVLKIGEALGFAHEKGVVHRDVKPSNIILDVDLTPKLTDFDLVRAADTTGGTRTGMLGTVIYAAPEAMAKSHRVGSSVDVFGLGMTAVFVLHGQELHINVLRNAEGFIRGLPVPQGVQEALCRAVTWRVEERWNSVGDLCRELASAGETVVASGWRERSGGAGELRYELNPDYSFSSLVGGGSNELALRAAKEVAAGIRKYDPLFVYGGASLGKTHLLHAIGNEIRGRDPDCKLVYTPAEGFVNALIESIRFDRMQKFRARFRSADVLLVDDIQFLAHKERTQEEFYHTFNAISESLRLVVLSADRPPGAIPGLDERLRSRFEGGLILKIDPPELDVRLEILKRKAMAQGISLPEEVAVSIANHAGANIRLLEGSLNRLGAFAAMNGRPVTRELAEEALGAVLEEGRRGRDVGEITRMVAAHYGLSTAELRGPTRAKHIVLPRQVAMYLARELGDLTVSEIGEYFGNRHHSSVKHSLDKIHRLRYTEEGVETVVSQLLERMS